MDSLQQDAPFIMFGTLLGALLITGPVIALVNSIKYPSRNIYR